MVLFATGVSDGEPWYYFDMENIPKELKYIEKGNPGVEKNVDQIMQSVKVDLGIILEKIRNSIDSHKYGITLGVDSGGRVPALTLSKTINNIYDSRGQEKMETYFIAGSRNLHQYKATDKDIEMEKFFMQSVFQKVRDRREKVLIVDDVVATGDSLELITTTLKKLNLPYEIATLSFDDSKLKNNTYSPTDIEEVEDRLGSNIVFGEYGGVSKLYGSNQMQGVHKSPDELYSKPLNTPISKNLKVVPPSVGVPFEQESQNKEVLRRTRELVSKISDELAQEYLK